MHDTGETEAGHCISAKAAPRVLAVLPMVKNRFWLRYATLIFTLDPGPQLL
jgi:hypothetical protein